IEGVRVVIDSGLARVPKFSPASGMTRLTTIRVSRASAEQRRGRAGRTAPGACYRLWAEQEDDHLLPRTTPEILEADLAPLALELAAAAVDDPGDLAWLDPPPSAAFAEARLLLQQLGALDPWLKVTEHGRRMAELGTHPRLAHLLIRGAELGAGGLAADLTALLEERDILRGTAGPPDADLQLRLELLALRDPPLIFHGCTVDRGGLHRVRDEARAWRAALRAIEAPPASGVDPPGPGLLLALAYPDRLGQRREGQAGRFLLRNGQGAHSDSPAMVRADFIVAAELDGDRRESRVWLGASISLQEIETHFGEQVHTEALVEWDSRADALIAARRGRLGAIVLREMPLRDPDPAAVTAALLGWIRREGIGALHWREDDTRLRERLAFLYTAIGAPWPEVSDSALLETLEEWLGPQLTTVRRRADLGKLDLQAALLARLGWAERRALDELAPTHLAVPTGSQIRVDYSDSAAPVLAVRLQEVFGLMETPRVGGGRVPVTMHLLSPARRPVQVTQDLAGFWRTSYFDVKKEMKGRYPKHPWPDDPLVAEPTRRAKPRPKKE
ncbi:MAG: ATP-dependent helicase HrpB, partial [Gemmatimonadota bacterium]